jgi:hypothetical protein
MLQGLKFMHVYILSMVTMHYLKSMCMSGWTCLREAGHVWLIQKAQGVCSQQQVKTNRNKLES